MIEKPFSEMTFEELTEARAVLVESVQRAQRELSAIAASGIRPRHKLDLRERAKHKLDSGLEALREINERRRAIGKEKTKHHDQGRRACQILADLIVSLSGVPIPDESKRLIEEAKGKDIERLASLAAFEEL